MIRFLFPLILLISCSTVAPYSAVWHTSSIEKPDNYFHKENHMALRVDNDSAQLYIKLTALDTATIQKILKQGLSLWISQGKTPKKRYAIHYPLPSFADFSSKETTYFNQMVTEGFYGEDTPVLVELKEVEEIKTQISFDENTFNYHVNIPWALLSINFEETQYITIEIMSFLRGEMEYTSGMNSAEVIERRLDKYKAIPLYEHNPYELIPFFETFRLAKMPNKNL